LLTQLAGDAGAVLRNGSFWSLVAREGGGDIATQWITQLEGDAGAVMRKNSFWSLVGRDGGGDIATRWITQLEVETRKYLRRNSFWSLVGRKGGGDIAMRWISKTQGSTMLDAFWILLGKSGGEEYLEQHYKTGMTKRVMEKMKSDFCKMVAASTPAAEKAAKRKAKPADDGDFDVAPKKAAPGPKAAKLGGAAVAKAAPKKAPVKAKAKEESPVAAREKPARARKPVTYKVGDSDDDMADDDDSFHADDSDEDFE
jgi:hypothetical protein